MFVVCVCEVIQTKEYYRNSMHEKDSLVNFSE